MTGRSIRDRKSKVRIDDVAPVPTTLPPDFLDRFPNILGGNDLKEITTSILEARKKDKPVILAFGAHLIKTGMSKVICQLIRNDIITGIATNGASLVHDTELAIFGHTSEEVDEGIVEGTFGTTEETAGFINNSINNLVPKGYGIGRALGHSLAPTPGLHIKSSIFATAFRYDIPATCHVALGTDVWQCFSNSNWSLIGQGAFRDFEIFTKSVKHLGGGGVFLNFGSAVIIPEVFLKAVAINRAEGVDFTDMVAADFDMIRQYRPQTRIVQTANNLGGKGYSITCQYELLLPILAALLTGK